MDIETVIVKCKMAIAVLVLQSGYLKVTEKVVITVLNKMDITVFVKWIINASLTYPVLTEETERFSARFFLTSFGACHSAAAATHRASSKSANKPSSAGRQENA